METIKEAANKYAGCTDNCLTECNTFETNEEKGPCCNRLERRGFMVGVNWAERWIPINEGNPENYDFVIMKDKRTSIHSKGYFIVVGRHAKNWGFPYIEEGYTHWRPIKHK